MAPDQVLKLFGCAWSWNGRIACQIPRSTPSCLLPTLPTYAHFLALINMLDIIACTCTLHVPPV